MKKHNDYSFIENYFNSKYLIAKSTNRNVYDVDGKIYKVATNLVGLKSNNNEYSISGTCENTISVNKIDDYVIECSKIEINQGDMDYFSCFGTNKNNLNRFIDASYLRSINYKRVNNETKSQLERFYNTNADSLLKNKNVETLNNITNKYRIEPTDCIHGLSIINNKPILFDFGLTEDMWGKDIFGFQIKYNDKIIFRTHLFMHFDGKFRFHNNNIKKHLWKNFRLPKWWIVEKFHSINPKNGIIEYNYCNDKAYDPYK